MSATTEILCDGCGEDIQYTGNCEDYRLVLRSESKAPWYLRDGEAGGGFVTAMAIPDPMPTAKHFCGIECLSTWLVTEYPKVFVPRHPNPADQREALNKTASAPVEPSEEGRG